jgi:hypothetical protein
VLPLAAGVAELSFFVGRRPSTTGGQIQAYGAGFVLAMAGLVIAGPWLTMLISRIMARRTGRPAVLIAGRRLADNPKGAFRAVSGLIVALFISTAAAGVITTIVAYHSTSTGGVAGRDTLSEDLGGQDIGPDGPQSGQVGVSDAFVRRLASIRGVEAVTVVHADARAAQDPGFGPPPGLVSCAQLSRMPSLGRCAPGVLVASVPFDFGSRGVAAAAGHPSHGPPLWPAAAVSIDQLEAMPVQTLYAATDGSSTSIEQARTTIESAFPSFGSPSTIGEISPGASQLIAGWRQLADVAIIASLVIAACSLAVSVAAGLVERKRPFSLLRLTGAPIGVLRRVVALEAAAPLVAIAVLSASTGLLAAHLFLRSQLNESLRAPGVAYYLTVGAGVMAALAIIASTLPLLERITGPDAARNE